MVVCDCPGNTYLMKVYATDFGGSVSSSTVRVTVNESLPTTTAATEALKDRYDMIVYFLARHLISSRSCQDINYPKKTLRFKHIRIQFLSYWQIKQYQYNSL